MTLQAVKKLFKVGKTKRTPEQGHGKPTKEKDTSSKKMTVLKIKSQKDDCKSTKKSTKVVLRQNSGQIRTRRKMSTEMQGSGEALEATFKFRGKRPRRKIDESFNPLIKSGNQVEILYAKGRVKEENIEQESKLMRHNILIDQQCRKLNDLAVQSERVRGLASFDFSTPINELASIKSEPASESFEKSLPIINSDLTQIDKQHRVNRHGNYNSFEPIPDCCNIWNLGTLEQTLYPRLDEIEKIEEPKNVTVASPSLGFGSDDSSECEKFATYYSSFPGTKHKRESDKVPLFKRPFKPFTKHETSPSKKRMRKHLVVMQKRVSEMERSLKACQKSLDKEKKVNKLTKSSIEDLMKCGAFPAGDVASDDQEEFLSLTPDEEMKMLLSQLAGAVRNLSQELKDLRSQKQLARPGYSEDLRVRLDKQYIINYGLKAKLQDERRRIKTLEEELSKKK